MRKLFKLLSLIRLVQELRHGRRGSGYGPGYHGGYSHHRGYGHDYHPLHYGRPRRPKLKHLVRDLLIGRRY